MIHRMLALTVVSGAAHESRHQIGPLAQDFIEKRRGADDRAKANLSGGLKAVQAGLVQHFRLALGAVRMEGQECRPAISS